MIDDVNKDGTQWARFSDDRKLRFRWARAIGGPMGRLDDGSPHQPPQWDISCLSLRKRVVFIMLNPSTADAFRADPTVKKCVAFATAWGAEVVEVVNIFALRSTDPDGLKEWTRGLSSDEWAKANSDNLTQIAGALIGADMVVAAWGKHGAHLAQGTVIRAMIWQGKLAKLHYLDLNKDGSPKHPLYIKGSTLPKEWKL